MRARDSSRFLGRAQTPSLSGSPSATSQRAHVFPERADPACAGTDTGLQGPQPRLGLSDSAGNRRYISRWRWTQGACGSGGGGGGGGSAVTEPSGWDHGTNVLELVQTPRTRGLSSASWTDRPTAALSVPCWDVLPRGSASPLLTVTRPSRKGSVHVSVGMACSSITETHWRVGLTRNPDVRSQG